MKKTIASLSTLALVLSASAQTVLFDFEDTNTVTNDFTLNQNGSGVFQQTSGGLSNSGRLRAPTSTNDFAAVVANGPVTFNTSSDFTISQSVYFKTTATAGDEPDDEPVILGITDQASQAAPGNYALMQNNFVNVALRTNTLDTGFPPEKEDFGFVWLGSSQNNSFTGQASGAQLAADSWYLLTVDYNYDSVNNEWDIDREVFGVDSDGANATTIAANTFSLANPFGANQDIFLYGFLAGDSGDAGSIEAFDNATLVGVPEPSAYALIAGSFALAWIMFRRRS